MYKIILFSMFSILLSIDETVLIEATSFSDWKYFSFSNGIMSEVELENSTNNLDWDIGIMRNHFRTNSGKSGPGIGGVIVDSSNVFTENNWDQLVQVNGVIAFVQDSILDNIYDIITHTMSEAPGSNVFETWGSFDLENNYQFNVTNYQYIFRTANGSEIIKMWIQDYYNDLGQSAHITLRYSTNMTCDLDLCGICGGDGSFCLSECSLLGDLNSDGGLNILDVVTLVNCVINQDCEENDLNCADINQDNGYNILDVVSLINCIVDNNCN